jgi:hypothetical protein
VRTLHGRVLDSASLLRGLITVEQCILSQPYHQLDAFIPQERPQPRDAWLLLCAHGPSSQQSGSVLVSQDHQAESENECICGSTLAKSSPIPQSVWNYLRLNLLLPVIISGLEVPAFEPSYSMSVFERYVGGATKCLPFVSAVQHSLRWRWLASTS